MHISTHESKKVGRRCACSHNIVDKRDQHIADTLGWAAAFRYRRTIGVPPLFGSGTGLDESPSPPVPTVIAPNNSVLQTLQFIYDYAMAMTPILANAIDLPLVFLLGFAVLVPLMAFQVFVEAFVLGRHWKLPARQLWAAAFFANCCSLAAGIPVKIANSFLYDQILPKDRK